MAESEFSEPMSAPLGSVDGGAAFDRAGAVADGIEHDLGVFGRAIAHARNGITITDCRQPDDPIVFANEPAYPGLGIGLYIASEIVKQHGGRISVESAKGRGSTFRFSLPAAPGAAG